MSRLDERLRQRRLRPHWRDMSVADLVDAVKLEVGQSRTAELIDWERMLLKWLREGDQFLHELDPNDWPVKPTKRAVAQALVEGLQVPSTLLTWLGHEILQPARAKTGPKPNHARDHEIYRAVVMVAENTKLPIDDAEHCAATAMFVVAEAFGMQQARVKDIFYHLRTAYNSDV
jgi:hypothetical protein